MTCTKCHFENPGGMNFCGNCGTQLKNLCSGCGFENPAGFKFCGNCGNSLRKEVQTRQADPEPATMPPANSEVVRPELKMNPGGERRHMTVMFCDLVGSTALSNELDAEDLRHIVTEYQAVCQKVVARFEGHMAQYLGDGVLVYFGYPTTRENDAHRAISSGLGIIEAMKVYNDQLEADKDIRIAVRIGIHTGYAVIGDILSHTGQHQQMAHGVTLNIAARLEGLADPDTLIISENTYQLVHRFFHCEDKGEQLVKGIDRPLRVYRVIHENTARSRFENTVERSDLLPIVGRDAQIDQLKSYWEAAKRGKAHVVMVSGDAGIGKSRTIQSIMAHVATEEDAWLMWQQCSPYHRNSAFYPMAKGIKEIALQLKGDEPLPEQIRRLEGFLLQNGLVLEEILPLFANIMSISLEGSNYQPSPFSAIQQREKIIGAFIHLMLERSRKQDLLVVFEDMHWADPGTIALIEQLVRQSPEMNQLTVVSFRPEFDPPWGLHPHLVSITLSRLEAEAITAIIRKITNGKELPAQLVSQIIQKTDGIPLFVEELTKMVIGSDIVRDYGDHYELTGPLSALRIPGTLHDSLVARLDRMSHTKAVAQAGACIGREFKYELIAHVVMLQENDLRTCLTQLVDAKLLMQKGMGDRATFRFRHALIRDAAYDTLLKSQRRDYHRKIAEVMVTQFPELSATLPQIPAYHYEEAGLTEEAVIHWTRAGDKVRQHAAYDEALNCLENGLKLIDRIGNADLRTQLELKILSIKSALLLRTKGWAAPVVFEASWRLKELAEAQNDPMNLFQALRGVVTYRLFSGNAAEALQYARAALGIARQLEEPELLTEAHRLVGHASIYLGQFSEALNAFDAAIDLHEASDQSQASRFEGADPVVFSLIQSSHTAWYLGYPGQAVKRAEKALKRAEAHQQVYGQVLCHFISSMIHNFLGNLDIAIEHGERCLELTEAYGITMFYYEQKSFLGSELMLSGKVEEGHRHVEEAFAWRRAHHLMNGIHLYYCQPAGAYLQTGQLAEGMAVIEHVESLRSSCDDVALLSETYRIKAELLLAMDGDKYSREIEHYLAESLTIARQQQARSLELRTAISTALWWNRQGMEKEALELIEAVYAWFTEGFESRDLQRAKALIEKGKINAFSAN